MPLKLETAMTIQRSEVRCFAMGPFSNKKYGSICYLMEGTAASVILMSVQRGEYSTCKEAIDKLENIVKAVRELNLPEQQEKLGEYYV